MLFRRR